MFSKINNILWPELWLLKFYFHQHYHCTAIGRPFLISYLFQHGHFFSSWPQLFYSQGVFGWDTKLYEESIVSESVKQQSDVWALFKLIFKNPRACKYGSEIGQSFFKV